MLIESEELKKELENPFCYFMYYGEIYIDKQWLLNKIKQLEDNNVNTSRQNK